jgi:hypothetical protein
LSNIVTAVLLIALTSAANDLVNMRASARAHACCAKTRFACAGLKSADDCCKRMRHTAAQPAPDTITAIGALDLVRLKPDATGALGLEGLMRERLMSAVGLLSSITTLVC